MVAAMTGDQARMRLLILAGALLTLPNLAAADPAQEARSATGACLAAVIDGAPVDDIDGEAVTIRRGADPVSCTVRVTGGEPVVIREAVLAAIKRRSDLFSPARTRWEPGLLASRETYCNIPSRRSFVAVVATSKPGGMPVLSVTVSETPTRDVRCDQDQGLQTAEVVPEPAAVAPVAQTSTPPSKAKKSWLQRLPGFGRKAE
jgi:hypothetical protein